MITDNDIKRFLRRCLTRLDLSDDDQAMIRNARHVEFGVDEAIQLELVEAFAAV